MKSDEENSKITNNKNNNKKTIVKNKQRIIKTKTNLRYNKPLWNQQKYQVGIWCQPRVKQSLDQQNQFKLKNFPSLPIILNSSIESSISSITKDQIVDIIPPSNTFPLSIKTSFGSTISSLTKEESYEKKHNKVETFLKNWKNKRNNKTNRNNKFNKKNNCKKSITYSSRSSNSSICSSSISEVLDHNIPSNNNSINSSTTMLSNNSNSNLCSKPKRC